MSFSAARGAALSVLLEVEQKGAYANLALKDVLARKKLAALDRGLATELVYGSLKARNTLDWALEKHIKKGVKSLPAVIRQILRLGAYQLIYLDRIPPAVTVNESVEMAKHYGHPGTVRLVNGVLRNLSRSLPLAFPSRESDLPLHLSLKYSHPLWLVRKWLNDFGPWETEKLLLADNQPPDICIRVNTLKISRAELAAELAREKIDTEPSLLAPEGLKIKSQVAVDGLQSYRRGLFQVQDEGSMLVSLALNPAARSTVIDACAAPGGKTTHLAQLMDNRGRILALDVHRHKLDLIEANCRRLSIGIVDTILLDARQAGNNWREIADFILVDAPCSGLGVLRRRPDARWRKEPQQLEELQQLQLNILQGVWPCLKPGGILVYSTCSVAPEENREVVNRFTSMAGATFQDLTPYLPFIPAHAEEAKAGTLQLLPQVDGSDGFFMARMQKPESRHCISWKILPNNS